MKVIIALGNPGKEYLNTRHNVGRMVLSSIVSKFDPVVTKRKYYIENKIHNSLFVEPRTYMNLSGLAAKSLTTKYKDRFNVKNDLLVIADDVNLPLGKLRYREGGSSGGHNGLQSIIDELGTDSFNRLRIGIGGGERDRLHGYVLEQFSKDELAQLKPIIATASESVLMWIDTNIQSVMNEFN